MDKATEASSSFASKSAAILWTFASASSAAARSSTSFLVVA